MIENFRSLIEDFGYVPQSGRVYNSRRTHPPFFGAMVKNYFEATKDESFAVGCIEAMITEYTYWETNYMVTVEHHSLFRYNDNTKGPRPESYKNDKKIAKKCKSKYFKEKIYTQLKAGSTSSLEFSSKWIIKGGSNKGDLSNMQCNNIIPVELNSVLYLYAQTIAYFALINNDTDTHTQFTEKSKAIFTSIQHILWNEKAGIWFDYDLLNKKHREYFSILNFVPIWAGVYDKNDKVNIAKKVINYLTVSNIDQYLGGVPQSLVNSGEQWDFPNVWPSAQYIFTLALESFQQPETTKLANKYAERFITSCFIAYNEKGVTYEKVSKIQALK